MGGQRLDRAQRVGCVVRARRAVVLHGSAFRCRGRVVGRGSPGHRRGLVADQELTAGLDLGVQLAEVLADLGDFLVMITGDWRSCWSAWRRMRDLNPRGL